MKLNTCVVFPPFYQLQSKNNKSKLTLYLQKRRKCFVKIIHSVYYIIGKTVWWGVARCAKMRIIFLQKFFILPHFTFPQKTVLHEQQSLKPPAIPRNVFFLSLNHYFSSQGARGQSATSAGWEYRCTNVSGHDGVQPRQLQQSSGAPVPATLPHGGYRWQWRPSKVHRNAAHSKQTGEIKLKSCPQWTVDLCAPLRSLQPWGFTFPAYHWSCWIEFSRVKQKSLLVWKWARGEECST